MKGCDSRAAHLSANCLLGSRSCLVAQRLPMCDDVLIFAIGRKRRSGRSVLHHVESEVNARPVNAPLGAPGPRSTGHSPNVAAAAPAGHTSAKNRLPQRFPHLAAPRHTSAPGAAQPPCYRKDGKVRSLLSRPRLNPMQQNATSKRDFRIQNACARTNHSQKHHAAHAVGRRPPQSPATC